MQTKYVYTIAFSYLDSDKNRRELEHELVSNHLLDEEELAKTVEFRRSTFEASEEAKVLEVCEEIRTWKVILSNR